MFRTSALTFAFASLALGASALAEEPGACKNAPTVSVVGFASEDARPDVAVLMLNVSDDRPSANDAANENARMANVVIDGLKGSGVDAKDITTVGLSLAPIMSEVRDPKTNQVVKYMPTGYRASNVLRVRVREIDRAGALVAASVQNGALYQGVRFELSDRETRADALRVKAVENAEHRAALYAQGASMKLGPLRSLGGDASGEPMVEYAAAGRALSTAPSAAPLTIEPGLITLSERVTATWELTAP